MLFLGYQCIPNLRNIAVREGQLNTLMNMSSDPNNVKYTVTPTSDELTRYIIRDFDGSGDATVTGLYDVTPTGLNIKTATTAGNPISTAGLYIGQCANNPNRTGAKLLVVRKFIFYVYFYFFILQLG